MNIYRKFSYVITASIIVLMLTNSFVLRSLVYPGFAKLEHDESIENVNRALEAIKAELDGLNTTVTDYANWDDSYLYATDGNPTFIERNFLPSSVKNINIDIIHIETTTGKMLYEDVFDEAGARVTTADRLSLSTIDPNHVLTPQNTSGVNNTQGLITSPKGPLLVVSRPILRTTGEGPAAGRIIMGRFLTDDLISTLRTRTRVDFHISDPASHQLDAVADGALGTLSQSLNRSALEPVIHEDAEKLTAYSLIRDLHGAPALLVQATTPRNISELGLQTLTYAMSGLILTGFIIIGIMAVVFERMLIGPLTTLTQRVVAIGRSGYVTSSVSLARTDELGTLSREFDTTLKMLAEIRRRLLEQSYRAGVAEMASGVLHNLRNQLAPLLLRIGRLSEQMSPLELSWVDQATDRLAAGNLSPDARDKTVNYIKLSTRDLHSRLGRIRSELGALTGDVDQIMKIIDELDRFSHAMGGLEATPVLGPVRDAVSIIPEFPGLKIAIALDPGLETCPVVMTRGFLLKHVIFNLLVNASEAVLAAGKTHDTIEIKVEVTKTNKHSHVDIQVRDNGIGIDPDQIITVFSRGYTTKKDKKRGTGLHWCANNIAAMGGRIFAESRGINAGATFHVLLPLAEQPSTVITA